jgi:hypothetical protein
MNLTIERKVVMVTNIAPSSVIDLAGLCTHRPNYLHVRARINCLVDRYLTINSLSDRLSDLPQQFTAPHQRPWERINWKAIHSQQIIGIKPAIFLQVLAGAAEIETPIRAYALESWNYLQALHPQMARFMGGVQPGEALTLEIGVWEKEERQHAPVFSKLYQSLTGEKISPKPNSVQDYQPTQNPWQDLQLHLISRITTEWSASAVYLWLMAHSTGELQHAIAQPLQDEINHLAKFWGFCRWGFGNSFAQQLQGSVDYLLKLVQHHQQERTYGQDLSTKSHLIQNLGPAVTLAFSFTRILVRLRAWDRELSSSYLRHLLGASPQPLVLASAT